MGPERSVHACLPVCNASSKYVTFCAFITEITTILTSNRLGSGRKKNEQISTLSL